MNLQGYDLDSLRELVRKLEKENKILKEKLIQAQIPFDDNKIFDQMKDESTIYDEDQPGRIHSPSMITDKMANLFFYMFWGRKDVYAKRGKQGGYFPQCNNRWNDKLCPKQKGQKVFCHDCEFKNWKELHISNILEHLKGNKEDGSDGIGIYPLFENGTCRFIVFDFDHHLNNLESFDDSSTWQEEVDALRKICELNGISPLVERSRSGNGAHVWIFFNSAIPASMARNFAFLLLEKGSNLINLKSFHYYDRIFPSQDSAKSLGNLIALPLHGSAVKNGNCVFVDENWNAYSNQWKILFETKQYSYKEIEHFIIQWQCEIAESQGLIPSNMTLNRLKPWKKQTHLIKEDVIGKLHIVYSNGLYVDSLNLMPRIQNQIRSLAAFDNPQFYKNKRLGYSNYSQYSSIYLGKDINGYIQLPRGLKERLLLECEKAHIEVEIDNQTQKGRPIRVEFKGDLRAKQDIAVESLLTYTEGVLSAATAFGKTVVCSYLIAQRKVNTLILLQNKRLLFQWLEELNNFLIIDEIPPFYETKTGKKKQRDSVIGILQGNKNTLTGIVDIAMMGTLNGKGNYDDILENYGMVIVDECHHVASNTGQSILTKVKAQYVYGVSATPKREDQLDPIIFMFLGPIRHRYTSLERAKEQGIAHYFIPRYTQVVEPFQDKENINESFQFISTNKLRNEMIIQDVKQSIINSKTPVILTRFKEHAKYLYDCLQECADYVFLLYGDHSDKENEYIRHKMLQVSSDKSLILIATGQMIGEGFNFPRLDILFLASPISSEGRVEQFVGRLDRIYEGKEAVYVCDYVDAHIQVFNRMYSKRLKTYKKMGYRLWMNEKLDKQQVQAIYDSQNYTEIFERDLIEADQSIIISSPQLIQSKVERFLYLIQSRQQAGVKVSVVTTNPENAMFGNVDVLDELIFKMRNIGIVVYLKEEVEECFAVLDNELVWHGGMNLLGKEDIHDNLIRIKDIHIAHELLAMEYII